MKFSPRCSVDLGMKSSPALICVQSASPLAREYAKKRNLLLYLLSVEIEHLITWYNPTARPELIIDAEATLTAWKSQVQTFTRALKNTALQTTVLDILISGGI